jgi:general nucleoside transport system permease protein
VTMRLEKRSAAPLSWLLAPLAAIGFTLLACAALVTWAGAPVADTYALIYMGAFGSQFAVTETLTRATPLIFTGLAAVVAFRARLYNIGAEGQLYLGALASIAAMSLLDATPLGLPNSLIWLLMVAAGALAGALLLGLSAWLKMRYSVDEVVTTLLLNFVVLLFVSAMLDGPMKDSSAMGWPQSVALRPELELARLIEKTRLHTGFIYAIVLASALALLNRYTVLGFEMRMVGSNPQAAAFQGMPVAAVVFKTALLSGGLAGLAGVFEVAGRTGYLTLDMSPGYGYTGIVIALLAGLSPLAVVAAAIFVAAVLVGADSMSRVVSVPNYIADVMVSVALLSVLTATMLMRYRLRWR